MFGRSIEPTASDIVSTLDDAMSIDAPYPDGLLARLQAARLSLSATPRQRGTLYIYANDTPPRLRHRALCECLECWAN